MKRLLVYVLVAGAALFGGGFASAGRGPARAALFGGSFGRAGRGPALAAPAASLGAGVGALVRSTASSRVVQPQPRARSCHARGKGLFSLPDSRCTPGAIDPAVTQADIAATICRTGYTKAVRPPESVTEAEKRASLRAYGDRRPLHYYEYDHLVPLELGGARNDPRNLWPEPGSSPNPKDELEYRLRTRVCDGEMTLAGAQLASAHNWVAAYNRYVTG